MDPETIPTSAVVVLSSPHGRMRHAQRLIEKRDLQAAVKYGVKRAAYNQRGRLRYKFEFKDVVYISDETCPPSVSTSSLFSKNTRPYLILVLLDTF